MSIKKRILTDSIQKHDIEFNWLKAVNFIPDKGMIVIYDRECDDNGNLLEGVTLPAGRTKPFNYARIKIGDGEHKVNELPFVSGVGKTTSEGGEIFNDYEHNVAGGRGFKITSKAKTINGEGYYVLEGYAQYVINHPEETSYAVGDIWSAHIKNAYDFWGTIEKIDGNTIYVTNYVDGAKDEDPWTFWVHTNPTFGNLIIGNLAHAEGRDTVAIGQAAHAEGRDTVANENYSHAEGRQTKAAYAGHSEGRITDARGMYGHTENFRTIAGESAHAEGSYRVALGQSSHAEGLGRKNIAAEKDQYGGNPADETIGALGKASHVEGIETTAIGEGAHAEGYNTIAQNDYSHAEGYYNRITKDVYTPLDLSAGTPNNNAGVFINDKGQIEYDLNYTDVSKLVTMRHFGFAETFSGLVTLQFNFKANDAFNYNLYAITDLGKITTSGGKTGKGSGTITPINGYSTLVKTIDFNDKTKPYLSFRVAENAELTGIITLLSVNIVTEEIDTDIIHSVGNGTGDDNRNNAFVVYKDGHAEVDVVGESDKSIATKEYVDNIYTSAKSYTDQEIATFDFIKVVDKLPETGLENRFYLIPRPNSVIEGYGHTSGEICSFDGVSKCSITTTDSIYSPFDVAIYTTDGKDHKIDIPSAEIYEYIPHYECSIEGTRLTVTGKTTRVDNGEDINTINATFEVAEGSLINGVATYGETGNNYVVSWENTGLNDLFDEYIWANNDWEYLGTKTIEIDLDNYATKDYVEKEIATFDFIKVVNELPEQGLVNRIYLVPKKSWNSVQENDLFDEWIWINKNTEVAPHYDWEWITTKQLEIDLTNYVEKEEGKGLSTNDFTNADKTKLDSIVTNDTPKTIDGDVSGEVITIGDIHPVEQDVEVKVSSKNLLDFTNAKPYGSSTIEFLENGLTYTGNWYITFYVSGLEIGETYRLTCDYETTSPATSALWRFRYTDGTTSGTAYMSQRRKAEKEVERIFFYPEMNNTVHTSILTNIQLEKGETTTTYTPYIDSFGDVTVSAFGKNLFNAQAAAKNVWDSGRVSYNDETDEIYTNFTNAAKTLNCYPERAINYPAGTYTITVVPVSETVSMVLYPYAKGTSTELGSAIHITSITKPKSITRTINEPFYLCIGGLSGDGGIYYGEFYYKIQIELNATPTEYEPYKEPITYIADADGTVNNVRMIRPTMTLINNTDGILINAKYNKDINKTINLAPFGEEDRQIATIGDINNAIGDINSILAYIVDGGTSE